MRNQFIKDTSKAIIPELPEDTILVYREGYNLPDIKGIQYFDIEDYKAVYPNVHTNMIILVGLNRIISPQNRCNFIFEHLSTLTPHVPKMSIDNHPFIGEPWRVWFHYFFTKSGKFNVPYSYTIETEWQHWFYRNTQDCRLSGDNIKMFISDTHSDLDSLTSSFKFYDPDDSLLEWYQSAKEHVFAKYSTPKMFINNLLKEANKHLELKFNYDSYRDSKIFELPELGIYKFMVEENMRRMDIYNKAIS